MAKHHLPLPDVTSPSRFAVPTDRFDFDCHRETVRPLSLTNLPRAVNAGVSQASPPRSAWTPYPPGDRLRL